jgi:hypothetical protein
MLMEINGLYKIKEERKEKTINGDREAIPWDAEGQARESR